MRQFNASYNYFDGMSNAEVEAYQKDSVVGHRPTWKAGANAWSHGTRHGGSSADIGGRGGQRPARLLFLACGKPARPRRPAALPSRWRQRPWIPSICRAAATQAEIKSRFKELVKRHHPDANGGDTRSEDKLREIIQAYNYLKQAGLSKPDPGLTFP